MQLAERDILPLLSVCLSVRPMPVVSKRMYISSHILTLWWGINLSFYAPLPLTKFQWEPFHRIPSLLMITYV